jgi:hypothetical protein
VTAERDPVSELMDGGARALLSRAYARPGRWAETRLADPGPRHLAVLAVRGINPFGPDDVSARGGRGLDARSRWARGFVRALYYQHQWYSEPGGQWRTARRLVPRRAGALQVEVGRKVPTAGIIPAGRIVRIRLLPGGEAARRAVRRLPDSRRIYTDRGDQAARSADIANRDW